MLAVILSALGFVVWLYLIALIGRMVIGWIQVFSRDWHPSGVLAAIFEAIFTITDPPLRAVRRVIKPIRIGNVALDLAFMIVFFVVYFLANMLSNLAGTVG